MSNKRGALIVFEGCNRAGTSMQAKMLTDMLNAQGIPAKYMSYPRRDTLFGKYLHLFLIKKIDLPSLASTLLFFENLGESREEIEETLLSGVTMVINRYATAGAVYTAANTGESPDWYQIFSSGLPKPDCVMFLKVSKSQQMLHSDWGNKRFEHDEIQQRVAANYEKLIDDTWFIFDTDQDESNLVQNEILQKAQLVINEVQNREIELIKFDLSLLLAEALPPEAL